MTAPDRADPVLGFYGPGSLMWRINREAVLLGAGPTATLLQLAHPLIAEGVAHHSDFLADPFGRLRRTLSTTMDLVFGDGPAAEAAIRRLNGVHATVRGPVRDDGAALATGQDAYRALDPELLLWVQATLVVTSVRAYRRWVGRLSDLEAAKFWAEARSVGVRMGIPLGVSPVDWAGLSRYWARMLAPDGPIQVTDTARTLAPMLVRPPLPGTPGWAVDLLALPGLALLPARLAVAYGIPMGRRRTQAATTITRAVRLWTRAVPATWRSMPQARAADRRARAARPHGRRTGALETASR